MRQNCRILVTGAAGTLGRIVAPALREAGHWVRSLDLQPAREVDDSQVGDITDPAAVQTAMAGVDTVVHLAADPRPWADFSTALEPTNVRGVYQVFEAARAAAVEHLILASSVQTVEGLYGQGRLIGTTDAAPVNHYGLTKLWGEQMGEFYARCFGMSVIAARIGWFPAQHPGPAHGSTSARVSYLSRRDAQQFFDRAVAATSVQFAVVYATGLGGPEGAPSPFDLAPGRMMLDYQPQDRFPDAASAIPSQG
jgi:nucleoside-diphosphate-sugar epimerase